MPSPCNDPWSHTLITGTVNDTAAIDMMSDQMIVIPVLYMLNWRLGLTFQQWGGGESQNTVMGK